LRTNFDSFGNASDYKEKGNSSLECSTAFDGSCDQLQEPEMMILTLEDQTNGELVDFDLIDEADLPFLDKQTDIGL